MLYIYYYFENFKIYKYCFKYFVLMNCECFVMIMFVRNIIEEFFTVFARLFGFGCSVGFIVFFLGFVNFLIICELCMIIFL